MDSQSGEGVVPTEVYLKAQEFKNSGNEKFNNLNYKGAVVDYKKGLLHDPNNADLHSNISAAYIHLEKYIEAEEHAVYTIQLRPNFYKGYMRAAKAAHGKGMTKLALNRLTAGMALVTDPNGIKELTRLKNQYIAYLSLSSNKEREMSFDDSDMYQSEDEDENPDSENEDHHDDLAQALNPPAEGEPIIMQTSRGNSPPSKLTDQQVTPQLIVQPEVKKELFRGIPSTKEEQKKGILPKVEPNATLDSKAEDKDGSINKKEEKKIQKFLEICRDYTKDHQDLTEHVAEFKSNLKTASEAFLSGNYRKAVESYKAAKERVGNQFTDYEIDERQFHVIMYALCAALISQNTYDEIIKAIQALVDMETYKFSIPALYIQMARAYYKLNRFKTALEPLEKLEDILKDFPIFPTFSWPGTTETIQETTPTGLKSAMKELNQMCRMSHKPTAVCRFDNCLKTSTHILPSELIYNSDPDFAGFVRMICEGKCHIEFHISCWKSYKESICGIGKINDKDLCGRPCLTTDCVSSDGEPSLITSIEIIGSDGQVKSTMKLDLKVNVDSKKSKKKSKLDDKEKSVKPKKIREKKVREFKKPVVVHEEDEEPVEPVRVYVDPVKALQSRQQSLVELRKINFGLDNNYWNPKNAFFGRTEETMKAVQSQFLEEQEEKVEVRDAKEFIFSYFMTILKDEGPLKQSEVEDLWRESAGDFCDITVVLPNLKSMCELLTESTRFCQLEDYICLADQLEEAYETVKMEVSETVNFLMTGSASAGDSNRQISGTAESSHLPDLVNHPNSANNQSSSEDESYDGNSGDESGDSEVEVTEEEDNVQQPPPPETCQTPCESQPQETQEMAAEQPKPVDDGRFSLQEMLNEMTRVKSSFLKAAEDTETNEELDGSQDKVLDSTSNDTFETVHSDVLNATDDTKNGATTVFSESSIDEPEAEVFYSDEQTSDNGDTEATVVPDVPEETSSGDVDSVESVKDTEEDDLAIEPEEPPKTDQQKPADVEGGISPHSEVTTEERDVQTSPVETKDTISQTMESTLYRELNKKVEDLSNQLQTLNQDNCRLSQEIAEKEAFNKQTESAHEKAMASLKEETRKIMKAQEYQHKILKADFSKKEATFKQKEQELTKNMSKLEGMYASLLMDNNQVKNDMSLLMQDSAAVKDSLTSAMSNIKEFEASYKALEENLKTKLQKSQQTQLHSIKVYWDSQIKLLRKRCVDKISDMHSWLSMFPPQEVEDLPSWEAIRQNTMRWGEINSKMQQMENSFQEKCNILEGKIGRGEEVEELSTLVLPPLPEEPVPVPLDKIYKEFTEKHLNETKEKHVKRVEELTQLVVSQQLEIEKMKEANQQFQQLMNSFQMAPRMQTPTPMTTAFGGLALQYSYPPSFSAQFGQTPVPTLPPPTPDTVKLGSPAKHLPTGVQTLLQESSKTSNFTNSASAVQAVKEDSAVSRGQTPSLPKTYPFFSTPQPINEPSTFAAEAAPPLMGVAHNLLKSTATEKKDTKQVERSSTPKPEAAKGVTSRETTPVRVSTPAPTPEKSKKKKKTRSESKDTVEARVENPVFVEPWALTEKARAGTSASEGARVGTPVSEETLNQKQDKDDDEGSWNLVTAKPVITPKLNTQFSVLMSEAKPRGKQKLLANLQMKFPTTSERELDDIVKQVRDQNGGSLSGLLFEDIETRTERIIAKRNFMKTSTMGLVKFSEAAWGSVKQEETITWDNLQLDECTICLEPMGQDRTKVNCNHEFHTKCLRKWLKEKSVCPLCNKFTTMPDEFPAL